LIALSSRVAVLCDQQIVAIGTLREIVTNSHRFISNFFQGERGKRALMAVAEALVK
jgi:phospholipid/cholesterol/gamma-HCH transport system ATP-binding protein